MKMRLTAFCFALATIFTTSAFSQDCAPCAAAGDVSCAPCAPCATCVGRSCELFGGLRSLLACRPCVVVSDLSCAPAACAPAACAPVAPECGPAVPEACGSAKGGPIFSSNLPKCGPVVPSCGPVAEGALCGPAPVCGGEMFPYLKPCLYNAVHRPVNGVCKLVNGVFGALADVTTPTSDAGFFKPAYVKSICVCGEISCGGGCDATCGPLETAPQPCFPAAPSCK